MALKQLWRQTVTGRSNYRWPDNELNQINRWLLNGHSVVAHSHCLDIPCEGIEHDYYRKSICTHTIGYPEGVEDVERDRAAGPQSQ